MGLGANEGKLSTCAMEWMELQSSSPCGALDADLFGCGLGEWRGEYVAFVVCSWEGSTIGNHNQTGQAAFHATHCVLASFP